MKYPLNQIFYGPPGTGKTYSVAKLAEEIVNLSDSSSATVLLTDIEKFSRILNLIREKFQGEEFKAKYGFKCPVGVRGRNSDNKLYKEKLGSDVFYPLNDGIKQTFEWINKQLNG